MLEDDSDSEEEKEKEGSEEQKEKNEENGEEEEEKESNNDEESQKSEEKEEGSNNEEEKEKESNDEEEKEDEENKKINKEKKVSNNKINEVNKSKISKDKPNKEKNKDLKNNEENVKLNIKNEIKKKEKKENTIIKEQRKKNEKKKKSLSEIFSLNKSGTSFPFSYKSKSSNKLKEMEILKRKMNNLELKTQKLEKINNIFYYMIKNQNIEINNQNKKNELENLNKRFFLNNYESEYYNNNSNLPIITNYNNFNKNSIRPNLFYNEQPYLMNYHNPQALPYINEIERIINNYKLENDEYKKRREIENNYMRRIDAKINDFLLDETLKKNDNQYLRNQLKEMNDQLNYRLGSIEHNQRVQRQKIDYLMKNYFKNEKKYFKNGINKNKHYKDNIKTDKVNSSCINISPSYYNSKGDSYFENKTSDSNNIIYPYKNSKRIMYKIKKDLYNNKKENGGNMRKSSSMFDFNI